VPSACAECSALRALEKSQTPLGERVPSASKKTSRHSEPLRQSQTPLGERVPSAIRRRLIKDGIVRRLKPLSGNVCLRPTSQHTSTTCAYASQTPLGERVPSAERVDFAGAIAPDVSNPSRGTCAFGPKGPTGQTAGKSRLKPLSGNVCLRPKHKCNKGHGGNVSNPSRGTCAFGH